MSIKRCCVCIIATDTDTNLECRYCKEGGQETQEHIEECSGCNYERRGLDMSRWEGKVMFWRRMIAKLAATVAPGHVGLTPVCDNFIPAVSLVDDTINNLASCFRSKNIPRCQKKEKSCL